MGKLLNMAIAGSKAAAPTFEYASDGVFSGTVIVYKNGTIIFNSAAATAGIIPVTVVAGDTVRMTQTGGIAYLIEYSDNGAITNYASDSGTLTLIAGRAYYLYCIVP